MVTVISCKESMISFMGTVICYIVYWYSWIIIYGYLYNPFVDIVKSFIDTMVSFISIKVLFIGTMICFNGYNDVIKGVLVLSFLVLVLSYWIPLWVL